MVTSYFAMKLALPKITEKNESNLVGERGESGLEFLLIQLP